MAKDYIKIPTSILDDPEWARLSDAEWVLRMKVILSRSFKEYLDDSANQPYKTYLNSNHWQRVRRKKLLQANFCCENCGETKRLHIHHLTYKNIGREKLEELMVLCSKCHAKIHHKDFDNGI